MAYLRGGRDGCVTRTGQPYPKSFSLRILSRFILI